MRQGKTDNIEDVAYKAYRYLFGEKEARSVENRLDMNESERKENYPNYDKGAWLNEIHTEDSSTGKSQQNNIKNLFYNKTKDEHSKIEKVNKEGLKYSFVTEQSPETGKFTDESGNEYESVL